MPSILFVCTANRFRSPLAAALLRKALLEKGDAECWRVNSAGTWTIPGKPVIKQATAAARFLDIDLSKHRSVQVSRGLLFEHDLILVMQNSHREALLTEFPELERRIHLFSEVLEGRFYDVPDALESGESVFEISMGMSELIHNGLDQICSLALLLSDAGEKAERPSG